jgi:hypothetical protein
MARRRQPAVPVRDVDQRILLLRGERVLLGPDLALLYGVELRALTQAVKRNRGRFPSDFCFQLRSAEWANLKSHFVTSSWGGSRRALMEPPPEPEAPEPRRIGFRGSAEELG